MKPTGANPDPNACAGQRTIPGPTRRQLLGRALRQRCPHCGESALFRRFYTMHDACPSCGMDFNQADGNTWFFMYLTSGSVVGVCFLILFFWRPDSEILPWAGALMIVAALITLLVTLPLRKSLGMAMDYMIEPPSVRRSDPGACD